ncbi:ATP-dependent helicase, partial [Nocardia farcinica]|uniref:ATP-dependent helicase n=1 Tax=Nocardia farcinica TaxID=37329 RepID=UPI0024576C21
MRSDSAVRLVRRNVTAPRARLWGAEVRPLLAAIAGPPPARPRWRPWQVLGGPGTGKTALLVDLAAGRIAAGADPASVLVLTHSKQAAADLRDAVTVRLAGHDGPTGGVPGATTEPLVRTLHSYAFSVLRRHASAHGNPPPRLLTGAEQDAVLREMLRGDLADIAEGATGLWPQRLHAALGLDGFAQQLRDLMLRATERGLGPEDLERLGREHDRPEWVAAGRFLLRYEQALLLRWSVGVEAPEATAPALDAAELLGACLDALATDAELLAAERARIRYLFVDDAQHLDPQAATLIRVVGAAAHTAVVAGDPDQAVFTFRGADARFAADPGAPADRRVVLRENHRSGPSVRLAAARIAAKLPGAAPHRPAVAAESGGGDGVAVRVRVLATPAKEAALIADHLRRAHLTGGVPWSRMAVIVRSVPLSLAPLRRALLAAGVPVHQPAIDVPLARRRGAAWLLLALRALLAGERAGSATLFTADDALDLLAGPLGGADQISLRRLRRGIRRTVLARERSRGAAGSGLASGATGQTALFELPESTGGSAGADARRRAETPAEPDADGYTSAPPVPSGGVAGGPDMGGAAGVAGMADGRDGGVVRVVDGSEVDGAAGPADGWDGGVPGAADGWDGEDGGGAAGGSEVDGADGLADARPDLLTDESDWRDTDLEWGLEVAEVADDSAAWQQAGGRIASTDDPAPAGPAADDHRGLIDQSSAEVLRGLLVGVADPALLDGLTEVESGGGGGAAARRGRGRAAPPPPGGGAPPRGGGPPRRAPPRDQVGEVVAARQPGCGAVAQRH